MKQVLSNPLSLFTILFCITLSLPYVYSRTSKSASSIDVGGGVELAFLDSGAPPTHTKTSPYTTIFALHGETWYSPLFTKIIAIAPASNVRFVAITRRDYNGSTPYNTADLGVLSNGTETQRTDFLQARGLEIARFIGKFTQQYDLPAVSSDGQHGGIALLGWSFGNAFSLTTLSNVHHYPPDLQYLLHTRLRSLIMHEAVPLALGTPLPPQAWWPQLDSSIPAALQGPASVQWLTSYFQHGNLSTRDPSILSYIVPDIARPPSVFNMTKAQVAQMTNLGPIAGSDGLLIVNCASLLEASYRKALFDRTVRAALPRMKVSLLVGDVSLAFSLVGLWTVQEDDEAAGGAFVRSRLVHGINHFAAWDEPEQTMSLYLESL
ncbi:hypothetical protein C8Q79DRAFT_913914 [Trametes meyenii]|nr:hypothetical protein C8Q79DRAFT_913914 [Trametes meyenii]